MGGFWVFLSHTVPGFQLWFYFHLCMWAVHWGLLLRLPCRTWVCLCEGQGRRWCSCLGLRGSAGTRYSGELAARPQEIQCSTRVSNHYWPVGSSISAWRTSLPDREAWQATAYRASKSRTLAKQPGTRRCKTVFARGSSARES